MLKIKLFKPFISKTAIKYANQVLKSDQLAEGPMVKKFEAAFAKKYRLEPWQCVAVNSGSSALELAYELAGVGKGDRVVTPVLTCTATNIPILHRGAIPVFCDITDDYLADLVDMGKRRTKNTKAFVIVDFGGASVMVESDLPVIRDAAQSVGPQFNPQGDFVCVSFQAIKTLTTGDGGMLIVKTKENADKARRLRWFGYDREEKQRLGDTDLTMAGYKYQMNDISAAIGLGNLEGLDVVVKKRKVVGDVYKKSGLPIRVYPWLAILTYYNALVLKEWLATKGIETGQHHYRNDKYTIFGNRRKDLPNMDRLENQYLLLPYHHGMSKHDAKYVVACINEFVYSSDCP